MIENISCLNQAHGPKCRFFRHNRVGRLYVISTVGEPEGERLPGNAKYETRVFHIDNLSVAIARITHRTRLQARNRHNRIVRHVLNMLEKRLPRQQFHTEQQILLAPGLFIG